MDAENWVVRWASQPWEPSEAQELLLFLARWSSADPQGCADREGRLCVRSEKCINNELISDRENHRVGTVVFVCWSSLHTHRVLWALILCSSW